MNPQDTESEALNKAAKPVMTADQVPPEVRGQIEAEGAVKHIQRNEPTRAAEDAAAEAVAAELRATKDKLRAAPLKDIPKTSADTNGEVDKIPAGFAELFKEQLDEIGVAFRYNEFNDVTVIDGLPEFPKFNDAAMVRLRIDLCDADPAAKSLMPSQRCIDLCANEGQRNKYHPVRDYLDGLRWDGEPRVDSWLTDFLKVETTDYTRAVGRIFLVAAVRRIRQPGCKFDELLVLEGTQGTGKSVLLSRLATQLDWFTDDLPLGQSGKHIIEQTGGKWIIEFGELGGMHKTDRQALKSMLSRGTDRGRMAYARMPIEVPRQWIGVGTTNDSGYLSDLTGNRRYWPVMTGHIDLEGFIPQLVDQLWAEAVQLEANGESIRLDQSLWPDATEAQESRTTSDPFSEDIEAAVAELPAGGAIVFAEDLWQLAGFRDKAKRTQRLNGLMGSVMSRIGFERVKVRKGKRTPWGYRRGGGDLVKYTMSILGHNVFSGWTA